MRYLFIVIALFLSLPAFADESFRHEFFLGNYQNAQASATFFSGSQNVYSGGTGYNYRCDHLRDWQWGLDFYGTYSTYSSGSYTGLVLLVGPTYNLSNDKGEIANSFFAYLHFGVNYNSTSYSDMYSSYAQSFTSITGAWEAGIGKRFQLTDSVTYRPGVVGVYYPNTNNVAWSIIPVSFGINL